MYTLRERIQIALREHKKNLVAVAGGMNNDYSRMYNQIEKNADISADTLVRVLNALPDVSPAWLLMEDGTMYRDGKQSRIIEQWIDLKAQTENIKDRLKDVDIPEDSDLKDKIIYELVQQNVQLTSIIQCRTM